MNESLERAGRRALMYSLISMTVFTVVGTLGFHLAGGEPRTWLDSLYLTVVIVSTVGMAAKDQEFTTAEKVWIVFLIPFGIGVATYMLSSVLAWVTSGQIQQVLGRRQLAGKIRALKNHYIVCGFGRMGQGVCRSLAREDARFVLVDRDDSTIQQAEDLGYMYIMGDASDEAILRMAGIERAKGVVCCLPHDADNVFVTLTARGLNEKMTIIARSETSETDHRLLRAGADRVICPPVIGALKITRMLLHPAVEDLLDATTANDLAIDQISIGEDWPMVGKSLRDLALPTKYGLTVLAVVQRDGKRLYNPPAEHVVDPGEQMIVVGSSQSVKAMLDSLSAGSKSV